MMIPASGLLFLGHLYMNK